MSYPWVEHYPERQARPGKRSKVSLNSGLVVTPPDPDITNLTIYDLEGEPSDNIWVEEFEEDSIVLEELENMSLRLKIHPSNIVGRKSTGGVTSLDGSEVLNLSNKQVASELTIAAGIITATQKYHTVDTQDDDPTDNLDTINGGVEGMTIILRANNSARTIVVKNGAGNIICGSDCTLDSASDTWMGIYDGANWLETGRSDNAP